jgi:hypothetical protein
MRMNAGHASCGGGYSLGHTREVELVVILRPSLAGNPRVRRRRGGGIVRR